MYYRQCYKIGFNDVYNYLESIKNDSASGEHIITVAQFAQDLISDSRLRFYPCIDISSNKKIEFLYEGDINKIDSENHLVIKICLPGVDYNDKVIEYFYSKLGQYGNEKNVSWNDVLPIINGWY